MLIAEENVQKVIDRIKLYRANKWGNYGLIAETVSNFTDAELSILSGKLNVVRKEAPKKSAINHWLSTATRDDFSFLSFLLGEHGFYIEMNCTDENGVTALQEIYINDKLLSKGHFATKILSRGYRFRESDRQYLESLTKQNQRQSNEILNYSLCSQLVDRSLVEVFFNHLPTIHCLETAKHNIIVGFNYKSDQWAAFAINAIQNYSRHWEYLERAFQYYGIWDKIIQADRKGTFYSKLMKLHDNYPVQDYSIDPVILELYPEIA